MFAHPVHVPRAGCRRGWPSRCRGRSPWVWRCSTGRGSPARPRAGGHGASRWVGTWCARSPAASPSTGSRRTRRQVASAASSRAMEAGIGPYPSRIAGPSLAPRTTSRSMITPSWTFAAGPVGQTPTGSGSRACSPSTGSARNRRAVAVTSAGSRGRPGSGRTSRSRPGDPEPPQMRVAGPGPPGEHRDAAFPDRHPLFTGFLRGAGLGVGFGVHRLPDLE